MIFSEIREVFVALHRVDFRLGLFGLRAQMNKMLLDPYKGDCCIFIHPSHRQIKIVGATATGCFLVTKFFEAGALKQTLRFLRDPGFVQISKLELNMLLEGATFAKADKVPDWVTCETGKKQLGQKAFQPVTKDCSLGFVTHQRIALTGQAMAR